MPSREYSKRLGLISDEQLQTALDRFGLGKLLSAKPAMGGLFGQNILLASTAGEFVFRGAPHWNERREDNWQFPKERFFSRLVYESPTGPPVPWPYLIDEGRDIFGWPFAIVPRLPGIPLLTPPLRDFSPADEQGHARALGSALAALHTVTLAHPGHHDRATDSITPLDRSYADYVTGNVRQLMEESRNASDATTSEDVAWVEGVLQNATPALDEPFVPTVIHLDFSGHNALLDDGSGEWVVTGIIDWMTAESGHPEADLSRCLAHHREHGPETMATFLSAYRPIHPERPGFVERFRAFMLWERLLVWSYGQRNKVWFPEGLTLRRWVEPFTTMRLT